jgi:hypothetical protein
VDGRDGAPGNIGPQGPEGPEGPRGPQGIQGTQGETGPVFTGALVTGRVVDSCGNNSPYQGPVVIPGSSYVSWTDEFGQFALRQLPQSLAHRLAFPSAVVQPIAPIRFSLSEDQVRNLGTIFVGSCQTSGQCFDSRVWDGQRCVQVFPNCPNATEICMPAPRPPDPCASLQCGPNEVCVPNGITGPFCSYQPPPVNTTPSSPTLIVPPFPGNSSAPFTPALPVDNRVSQDPGGACLDPREGWGGYWIYNAAANAYSWTWMPCN